MIQIEGVVKRYSHDVVLNGLDIRIKAGRKATIIGSSGCGKSTLLRLVLGLEPYDAGEIRIDGQSLNNLDETQLNQVRLKFGMVFQSSALFDSMTVGENVALVLKEHTKLTAGAIKTKVFDALNLVGLKDTYYHLPSELSGGMKKRVAVARAIIGDPKILLFDEPTTGLDPVTSTTIEDLINTVVDKVGATMILVTHQISTILRTSEKIIMIHDGQAIKTEGPKKIMKSKIPLVYRFMNGLAEV